MSSDLSTLFMSILLWQACRSVSRIFKSGVLYVCEKLKALRVGWGRWTLVIYSLQMLTNALFPFKFKNFFYTLPRCQSTMCNQCPRDSLDKNDAMVINIVTRILGGVSLMIFIIKKGSNYPDLNGSFHNTFLRCRRRA